MKFVVVATAFAYVLFLCCVREFGYAALMSAAGTAYALVSP